MRARIIVHSLQQAEAALAAAEALAVPVTLASAEGAGAYAGPRWFLAVMAQAARAHPGATFDAVIDCADEAGTALAALRAGATRVRFRGAAEAREKLAAIAAALGAAIEDESPPALDLLNERDPLAASQAWLSDAGRR